MTRARATLLVAVLAVLAGAWAAPTLAAAGDGPLADDHLAVEFLEGYGDRPENAAPGVRAVGDYQSYQLVHYDQNHWWVTNPAESVQWSYLQPGETIERNSVWVRTKRAWGADSTNVTFNVVYWEKGTREVTEGNTTTTEPVAENVTVSQVNVSIAGGLDRTEIPLQPSFDKTKRITIWLDGNPGVKWSFKHHSNHAAVAMGHLSKGEFTILATGWLGVPILIFSVAALLVFGWLYKVADAGPQVHPLLYFFAALTVLPIVFIVAWARVADVVSRFPVVIGFIISLTIGGVAAWLRDDTFPIIFFKPKFKYGGSGTLADRDGQDDPGAPGETPENATVVGFEIIPKSATYTSENEIAIIPSMAPIAFLARLFGKTNVVAGAKDHASSFRSWGPYRHAYVTHPEAESVLDYRPEGFKWGGFGVFSPVTDDDGTVTGRRLNLGPLAMLVLAVSVPFNLAYFTTGNLALSALAGSVGLVLGGLTTREPRAEWEPAPVEMAEPLATMFNTLEGLEAVKDKRTERELWLDELADNDQKRRAFRDENDLTVLGEFAQRIGVDWRATDPDAPAQVNNGAVEESADD